jgi:hypothetical protein
MAFLKANPHGRAFGDFLIAPSAARYRISNTL